MATNMTRYGEGKILQALFKQVAIGVTQAQWYVGLHKKKTGIVADPPALLASDTEEVIVASHPNYVRKALGAVTYVASTGLAVPARIENDAELLWPEATTAWGLIVGVGFYDAATGGNCYCINLSTLANQRDVRIGDALSLPIDALIVSGAP